MLVQALLTIDREGRRTRTTRIARTAPGDPGHLAWEFSGITVRNFRRQMEPWSTTHFRRMLILPISELWSLTPYCSIPPFKPTKVSLRPLRLESQHLAITNWGPLEMKDGEPPGTSSFPDLSALTSNPAHLSAACGDLLLTGARRMEAVLSMSRRPWVELLQEAPAGPGTSLSRAGKILPNW